jgi:uncharacterized protein YfaQ (DUF2300 family)
VARDWRASSRMQGFCAWTGSASPFQKQQAVPVLGRKGLSIRRQQVPAAGDWWSG